MNTYYVRIVALDIISNRLQVNVAVKGTDGTDSLDGYEFDPALTGEQFNTSLVNGVKMDFGVSGDRFILLGGAVAEVVK